MMSLTASPHCGSLRGLVRGYRHHLGGRQLAQKTLTRIHKYCTTCAYNVMTLYACGGTGEPAESLSPLALTQHRYPRRASLRCRRRPVGVRARNVLGKLNNAIRASLK